MRQAVIVSTARTPLTKSHRGELNITPGPTLAGFAVRAAVDRAGVDPVLIEDAVLGCGYPEGITGRNIARQAVIRSELPLAIAGITVSLGDAMHALLCGAGHNLRMILAHLRVLYCALVGQLLLAVMLASGRQSTQAIYATG